MKKAVPSNDLVRNYLKRIGRVPLLSHEQEITLGKQVQRHMKLKEIRQALANASADVSTEDIVSTADWANAADLSIEALNQAIAAGQRAKHKMIRSNLRLVVSIAKKYTGHGLEMMDLIQEGTIGLNRGVEKFDPTKGYRFSTYAYWWIRQAMTRALSNCGRTIRLPIHINDKLRNIRKAQRQLTQSLGRPTTMAEIAEELSLSVDKLREIIRQGRRPISLDMRIGKNQDTELGELLEDDGLLPEDYAAQNLLKADLNKLLSNLTEQQQAVIRMRYGLGRSKGMTLNQIGEQMGISRERVRQVEKIALRTLRRRGAGMREYATVS